MGVLDSIIGGVAGLAGNFVNQLTGNDAKSQQNRLMKWQEQMLDKQFNYQSEQAQINRDFQKQMYEDAKKYNSTSSKVKQAIDAGVNPYAALAGNAGTVTASTPSGSMPGTPSIPQPAQPNYVGSQSFNAVAAGLASLMQAAKTGVESAKVGRLLDVTVDKMSSEIKSNEVRTIGQQILNMVNSKTAATKVTRALIELDNASLAGLKTIAEVDDLRASITKKLADAGLTKTQHDIAQRYLDKFFDREKNSIIERNEAEAREADSAVVRNYAEASLAGSRAALADAQAAGQRLDNLIRNSTAIVEMRANNHSFDVIIKTSNDQIKMMRAQAEKLIAEGKYAEAQQIIGMMNQTINSVSGLINSFKPGLSNTSSDYGERTEYTYGSNGKIETIYKSGGSASRTKKR